jgi:molybdopterin-guanine dinucleotide biosynthesis protein MobB
LKNKSILHNLPILAVCGWSGSGKTTLIESVLPGLCEKGLKVAVLKHNSHGIEIDRPGKDSDRLFNAGADVMLQSGNNQFLRIHESGTDILYRTLNELIQRYDLVIVEGHKNTPLPKIWLEGPDREKRPENVENIIEILPWDSDREQALLSLLKKWLPQQWSATPLMGCVLIGGKSSRLGKSKHLLETKGRTWLETTVQLLEQVTRKVVIAGKGEIPDTLAKQAQITDPPDVKGPMAGLISAMRWAPKSSWIVAACDLPNISIAALEWLISMRTPGVWSIIPKIPGSPGVEALFAYYDFRARPLLEELIIKRDFCTANIASSPKVITPIIPKHLSKCWQNINTSRDLRQFLKTLTPKQK